MILLKSKKDEGRLKEKILQHNNLTLSLSPYLSHSFSSKTLSLKHLIYFTSSLIFSFTHSFVLLIAMPKKENFTVYNGLIDFFSFDNNHFHFCSILQWIRHHWVLIFVFLFIFKCGFHSWARLYWVGFTMSGPICRLPLPTRCLL